MIGLSRPIEPTVAALRCRSPVNQAAKASAVADHGDVAEAGDRATSTVGGAPLTATATGVRMRPPAMSCHEVSEKTSTPAAPFLREHVAATGSAMAVTEARDAGEVAVTPAVEQHEADATDPDRRPRPRAWRAGVRRARPRPSSIMVTGEVAMIVDAMLVGSVCAAR